MLRLAGSTHLKSKNDLNFISHINMEGYLAAQPLPRSLPNIT